MNAVNTELTNKNDTMLLILDMMLPIPGRYALLPLLMLTVPTDYYPIIN